MSYAVPGVAEFVVDQMVSAVGDVREILRGGASLYEDDRGPTVPAVWVTVDWVMARRVTVRAWVGLKEVVHLDLLFSDAQVGFTFNNGDPGGSLYADGLESLVTSWRDRVWEALQTRTEGEVS